MPDAGEQQLRLSDWLVLCVASEKPTHGFAVARLFSHAGSLGRVWQVSKPTVYAAMTRLEELGLVQMAGEQHTSQGPARSLVNATPAGQTAARKWLRTPVTHGRDVRSELLMKLALLDRAGGDPGELRIGQLLRPARPAPARDDHVVVDQHVQCRQEGFQVCSHERLWVPSTHFKINPTRRTGPDWEALVQRGSASDRRGCR